MAWGLWFPPPSCGAEKLLPWWRDGARLYEAHGGRLLVFASEEPVQTDRLAALPVVKLETGWASFPSAQPHPGEVVLRWQGEIWRGRLSDLMPFPLAYLWDNTKLKYVEAAQPKVVAATPSWTAPSTPGETREALTAIPPAAPEQKEWMRRLHGSEPADTGKNPLLGLFDLLASFFDSASNQRYLSRMVSFFEKGDWSQALRHAIPLGDPNVDPEIMERFLGKFRPRKNLDYTLKTTHGSYSSTSNHGIDLLRNLYYQAYQSLLRQERWEEAAFVQGELLGNVQGAVDLLEDNKLFAQAAKLATAKGLSASLQVRLWFQAGHTEQALRLARCHFVHTEALRRLQQKDPNAALKFRVVWATDLADMGEVTEAVIVGWEVRDQLPQFREWFEQVLANRGWSTNKAVAMATEDVEFCRETGVIQYLEERAAHTDPTSLAGLRNLLDHLALRRHKPHDPSLQNWAGRVARQVMRQAHSPWPLGDSKVLRHLVEMSADPWLKVDAPTNMPSNSFRFDRWHEVVEERGHQKIFDACFLGDGRLLLALGHAGLVILSHNGKVSQQFDFPAHSLATPLQGDITLTESAGSIGYYQQGRAAQLGAVDLWGHADCHDGLSWCVWRGNDLYRIALDTLLKGSDDAWKAVAHVGLPAVPEAICAGMDHLGVLLSGRVSYYHSPSFVYIEGLSLDPDQPFLLTPRKQEWLRHRGSDIFCGSEKLFIKGKVVGVESQDPWGVLTSREQDTLTLCIFNTQRPKQQLVLELPGAEWAKVRVGGLFLLVSDSCGRVLVANPQSQIWLNKFFL